MNAAPVSLADDTTGENDFWRFFFQGVHYVLWWSDSYDLMQQLKTHLETDLVGLKQKQVQQQYVTVFPNFYFYVFFLFDNSTDLHMNKDFGNIWMWS